MLNNKKYGLYFCFGLVFVLFVISLFVFKPAIKMTELYTLFARVSPDSLKPVFDFGGDGFMLPSVVPMIPNVEFFNYPLFFDIFLCAMTVLLITLIIYLIPNIFMSFCLGLSVILGFGLSILYMSRVHNIWIPLVWPLLVQCFMFLTLIFSKALLKQSKQLNTVKLFGYDVNLFPNAIPYLKNIVQQPKETILTMACFKIRVPQTYMDEVSPEQLIYKTNKFFQIIVDSVLKYGGLIDKTSNTTILCYWIGKQHALNAVKAGIDITDKIKQFEQDYIKISCGIATDEAVFGILGSKNFANYTVIGNITDIAARLENACIFHSSPVLISGKTLNYLKDKLLATHKGSISVHGLKAQIDFYEPLNFNPSYIDKLKERVSND